MKLLQLTSSVFLSVLDQLQFTNVEDCWDIANKKLFAEHQILEPPKCSWWSKYIQF